MYISSAFELNSNFFIQETCGDIISCRSWYSIFFCEIYPVTRGEGYFLIIHFGVDIIKSNICQWAVVSLRKPFRARERKQCLRGWVINDWTCFSLCRNSPFFCTRTHRVTIFIILFLKNKTDKSRFSFEHLISKIIIIYFLSFWFCSLAKVNKTDSLFSVI